MVGEFVILADTSNICQWADILFISVCSPFILYALVNRLLSRRRGKLSKLQWDETYFQRISKIFRNQKGSPDQKIPMDEGVRDAEVSNALISKSKSNVTAS